MDKTKITTLLIILIIICLLGFIGVGSYRSSSVAIKTDQSNTVKNTEKPNSGIIFFYGNTCPHCKDVEEWMTENKIEEKIEIVKKEVYDNRANSLELTNTAKSCGLPTNSIGVPFLYTADKKCLIGTPDITAYLAEQVSEQEQPIEPSESAERSQQ